MEYRIIFSIQAQKLFTVIKDRREQSVILIRIEKLKDEPEKQGKALSEELSGYRSIRAVGQTAQASAKVAPNTGEISEKEYPTGRYCLE